MREDGVSLARRIFLIPILPMQPVNAPFDWDKPGNTPSYAYAGDAVQPYRLSTGDRVHASPADDGRACGVPEDDPPLD